jgi:hypothetical protein
MGLEPRIKLVNAFLNRLLLSRRLYRFWEVFQRFTEIEKSRCSSKNEVLTVHVSEYWHNITIKTLAAMNYSSNKIDFDYLVRANSTCYINTTRLNEILSAHHSRILYAGPQQNGKNFISGWGIIMSKEAVNLLLSLEYKNYLKFFDDEAIGKMFHDQGVSLFPIKFLEIKSQRELDSYSTAVLKSFPLIRVKVYEGSSRIDFKIMSQLHERLTS